MADISVIKMPDNSSYNLKDAAARQSIAALPTDVQVNGTSVVSSNVANIPTAGANTFGVIKASSNVTGIGINNDGYLYISPPTKAELKAGTDTEHPVTSSKIKEATFYGLAKAANDSTQASSSNAVGKYTDAAKHAIQKMLGVTSLFANEESSTATAAHDVNSLFMMDGKLHQATSAIAVGDAVATGTNCTVVKADEVFTKNTDLMVIPGTNIGSIKIKDFSSSTTTYSATASGMASVAFGAGCVASGNATMAVGRGTTASGGYSFAAGYQTVASGIHSIAFGNQAVASGVHSAAFGWLTKAASTDQFAYGIANIIDNSDTYIQIAGNGTSNIRSNAYALDWNGNGYFSGEIYMNCNSDSTGGEKLVNGLEVVKLI